MLTSFWSRLPHVLFVDTYSDKLAKADCFRIGNIERISAEDVEALRSAIAEAKAEMNF